MVASSENEHQESALTLSKSIELRMKNLEQLKFLQQLFVDNVLSEAEYSEQKGIILDSLRNLK